MGRLDRDGCGEGSGGVPPDPVQSLLGALAVVVATWMLLAGVAVMTPWVGPEPAVIAAFAVAMVIVVASRVSGSPRRAGPLAILCAGAAGFAGHAAWIAAIASVGSGLGMEPRGVAAQGGARLSEWVAILVVAPVLEELLYRERLLGALRPVCGTVVAILLSSIAFAVPHLESWHVLGTFLVGIALGAVYAVSGSIAVCVALHLGLNLAGLTTAGLREGAFDPWPSAWAAAGLGSLSWWCARGYAKAEGPRRALVSTGVL